MTPSDNPYASPTDVPSQKEEELPQANAAGAMLLACGVIGLFIGLINLLLYCLIVLNANLIPIPNVKQLRDQAPVQLFINSIMSIQSIAMIAGGYSMIQRRRKWLATLGAIAALLPMCGCFILPAGAGVWALVAMHFKGKPK